jgi:alkylation response protein AidB-like acyl-CoA dehydrogenase
MTGLVHDSDEHQAIRETVGKIVSRYGQRYFLERARAGQDVAELWRELGKTGLLGVHLPEQYGGGGMGMQEAVVVVEELAAHGMPMLVWVISPAMIGSILAAHGAPEQKQRWLPGIADGTTKVAFGLTEPDAGSNSHNIKTAARRDGDDWLISGTKYYISAIDQCDAILVVTRDAGEAGNGLRQVFAALNPERILVGAITGGVGRYAIEKAVDYAKTRAVWSVPIGQHQGIAHPLAEAHINVELSRLATKHAATLYDQGNPGAGEAANMAKFAGAEAALKALDQSIQTHGGNGLANEYGLSELWFITRLMRTAPVSREMVLNFVAQTSLGLPRSY